MKRFAQKVQRLSRRAAELQQVVQGVPPRIVEIRDAVTAASTQVQKLRSDIAASVGTLRSETDTQLIATLQALDGHATVLGAAGLRLDRVEMDLGPHRRVVVRLERIEEVPTAAVQQLLAEHRDVPAVRALLTAALKAGELAAGVNLTGLVYTYLTVEIGLIPSVRIGWQAGADDAVEDQLAAPLPVAATVGRSLTSEAGPFFAPRPPSPAGAAASAAGESPAAAATVATGAPAASAPAPAPRSASWNASALDRFKKMPDLRR
jgi:hypothetical protein